MFGSWQAVAAVAAGLVLVWTCISASWGRLRGPAAAAAVVVLANAVAHEQGWFADDRHGNADANVVAQIDAGDRPSPQPRAQQGPWTLRYSQIGGIAGVERSVIVTDGGEITVAERRLGQRAVGRASPELMQQLSAFLRTARPAPPEPEPPMPDAFGFSLTLADERGERELELPDALIAVFDDMLTRTLRDAVVGSWEQAAWKLCRPVPSLDASQIDPPIGPLELRADGRFSVGWRGAGTQALAESRGRYRADPARGSIRFELDDPAAARDFAGTGRMRIDVDELRLDGVWFGTVQAASKPDICELTFRRVGAP